MLKNRLKTNLSSISIHIYIHNTISKSWTTKSTTLDHHFHKRVNVTVNFKYNRFHFITISYFPALSRNLKNTKARDKRERLTGASGGGGRLKRRRSRIMCIRRGFSFRNARHRRSLDWRESGGERSATDRSERERERDGGIGTVGLDDCEKIWLDFKTLNWFDRRILMMMKWVDTHSSEGEQEMSVSVVYLI